MRGSFVFSASLKPPQPHPRALFLLLRRFFAAHSSSSSPFYSHLRAAISATNLLLGKCTHARIITSGQTSNRFLTNNVIHMYSKCGSLLDARQLFDRTPDRDLVTWNVILAAYAQSAESELDNLLEGFSLFRLLRGFFVYTGKMTLAPVLKLCSLSGHVWASEAIHGYAVKIGLQSNLFVSGPLVNIYSNFGLVREARLVFGEMQDRDVVSWNGMLKAYADMGLKEEALCLFSEFHWSGLHPDNVSVQCILNGASDVASGFEKRAKEQIQAYATKIFGYNDNESNVVLWNRTLSEYIKGGDTLTAIDCFKNMIRSQIGHDSITLVVILAAAVDINDIMLGQQIHAMALKSGLDSDIVVANSLINLYSKMGFTSFSLKVYANMKELDLISWNSIISCCAQNGLEEESVNVFKDLLHNGLRPDNFTLASVLRACSSVMEGLHLSKQIHVHAIKTCNIADSFVSTSLIDIYSSGGLMREAEILFRYGNEFDLATWNAMMFGYITSKDCHKALELCALMHQVGEVSDEITLAAAAKACGSLVRLEQGKQIHARAMKFGFHWDLQVSSGILDMYVKCGHMVNARMVFNAMSFCDDVAWTIMISGYVENGDEDTALSTYHQMRLCGLLPDEYTLATLIKASSCLTALEQGKQIHANVIKLKCASDPYVVTSLIDMYAKCGAIEEAYFLFRLMNIRNIVVWNAMLLGLAQHGNGEEALGLFKAMESDGIRPDGVTFIGVLSACGHAGLTSEAYRYFDSMREDYGIEPETEHYSCLADAFGRAGRVQEAEKLILSMPFDASAPMYRALLGAFLLVRL
uniref:Pentatricopeptide repeat-containing protein At4g33170 n=1 Tax=Rhizophora mucronata TaxID=61149 RepID=A0A2P2MPG6_RHIMU